MSLPKPYEPGFDLAFLSDPSEWPLKGTATAVKRSSGASTLSDCATVIHKDGDYRLVDVALPVFIDAVKAGTDLPEPMPITPEALIADGWIVD